MPNVLNANSGLTLEPTPECILEAHGQERDSNWASVGTDRLER